MQDGVYVGLPHKDYLAVPDRLGSTDFTKLYARGPGWWWTSKHNPHYVEPRKDVFVFGSALHTLALEGRAAYEARYGVKPNPRDYPDLLTSVADLRGALEPVVPAGTLKAKTGKDELVQLARAYLKGRNVWDDIVERWARTLQGREALDSGDAFALEAMYRAAMDDEEIRLVLDAQGGVKLVELSVFYTDARGIKKRYRFDSLLPFANIDLKSVADWRSRPFQDAVADRIRQEHLNVQLAMSHEARLAAYKLIASGLIFHTGSDAASASESAKAGLAQEEWLRKFPTLAPLRLRSKEAYPDTGEGPGWFWLWLFYQKPEAGAAPTLLPVKVLWGEPLHRSGWNKLRVAENVYLENVARFGLSKPWTQVARVVETRENAKNFLRVIEYDAPMQQDGEGEAMQWR